MTGSVLWYSSRATGAVSLVLFTAVMVFGIATTGRAGSRVLPRAAVLRLHRTLSLLAVTFLTVHIVTAIVDGYVDLSFWDVVVPFRSGFDPLWVGLATVAFDLMLAIGLTSVLRRFISPGWWRAVHLTSYAMWPLALAHGWGVAGGDGRTTWMLLVDVACVGAVLIALVLWRLRGDLHHDPAARRAGAARHRNESDMLR